ncbi:MAG: squalene/phytoene synthase family protein [Aeromonadaceae bacterium]|nr:squalene/phytoene synthase family protein [Aeromonadaceae bacterium]
MIDISQQQHLLVQVSRSFALTIPLLPMPLQDYVGNAYLLCRIVDTLEDEPGLEGAAKQALLTQFLTALADQAQAASFTAAATASLSPATPPAEQALLAQTPAVLARYRSYPPAVQAALARCVTIMSGGMAGYQQRDCSQGLPDLAALDQYCYFVAGVVGEMLAELFILHCPQLTAQRETLLALGVSFGQGLQMTNILKDMAADRARGVCWLPRELALRQGLDLALERWEQDGAGCQRLLDELAGLAQGHLQDAMDFTCLLPARQQGIRQFCLLAIGMAVLTLKRVVSQPGPAKISRRQLKGVVLAARLLGRSDTLLQWWLAWLRRGCTLRRRSPQALRDLTSRWDHLMRSTD